MIAYLLTKTSKYSLTRNANANAYIVYPSFVRSGSAEGVGAGPGRDAYPLSPRRRPPTDSQARHTA